MNQKTTKRPRKRTEDDAEAAFKTPSSAKAKEEIAKSPKNELEASSEDENDLKGFPMADESTRADFANNENGDASTDSSKRTIQTRSRSNTPLVRTPDITKAEGSNVNKNDTNGTSDEKSDSPAETQDDPDEREPAKVANKNTNVPEQEEEKVLENGTAKETEVKEVLPASPSDSGSLEMESLVLEKDEEDAIPELQFDDNDVDVESEGSPSRCRTRRSQTRNMSTPKTPKLLNNQQEGESKSYVALERLPDDKSGSSTPKKVTSSNDSNIGSTESQPDVDLNDTSDTYSSVSTDNVSTRAVAGSDATRNVDFTYQDSGLFDENSFSCSPNRSLGETLRNLSSRRTIRPIISGDYRRFALKNNLESKGDVYADYESVEKLCGGVKRKHRSLTPDESKRFKKETPGLLSYFASPISNIKSTFSRASTPKLVAYEKSMDGFDGDKGHGKIRLEIGSEASDEKKWCSIM